MSLDINLGGTKLPTDPSKLKDLKSDASLLFNLESKLEPLLNTTLANVPANACVASISYGSPAFKWNPGQGPVQFGLQASAKGTLEIVTSGDLISYTDGLDSPQQKSIPLPPQSASVKLTLNFNISANASGNYSGGGYGVKAALDTSVTYGITYCKSFAPATPVGQAIAQTFESFMFPLHANTLQGMSTGDFLLHEFDGNLHLSFGAYAGIDRVLYAGQSSADVAKAFGSPLATLSGGVKPEIKAGVSLDFCYQYATRFEALLSKSDGAARLHLYRSQKSASSAVLKAGLTFDANATASISAHTQTLSDSVVKSAGGSSSEAGKAVGLVASKATPEVDKYVKEVNDKLASWLNKANGLQANLQVAIETNQSRTILAGYDFDTTSAQFANAWQLAVKGDFVAAFQTGAVTLDVGSGLEREYQCKTSFACNFFNLWKFNSWSEFTSNVSLVYAGNNVFHFVAQVGRTTQTKSTGAMRNLDFYFSATADAASTGQISHPDVELHVDLTATGDTDAANRIATMLSAIEGGPVCDRLARDMHAFATNSRTGTAQLKITIPSADFKKVNCDPYVGDKPQTNSVYNDSVNWNMFAKAADDLSAWPLRNLPALNPGNAALFKTFQAWEILNQKSNGATKPNRVNPGNPFVPSSWPEIDQGFPPLDSSTKQFVVASMMAGQGFMNFCADLHDLANQLDVQLVSTTWESLLKTIENAIRKDLNVDFIPPAALAIVRLCKAGTVSNVTGPTSPPTDHFAVAITL